MTVQPKYKRPVKNENVWVGLTKTETKSEYPWRWHCPVPLCFAVIFAATEEKADERIRNHTCPWFGGGTTTLSWGVMSDEYLTPIWEKLDTQIAIVKGNYDPDWDDDRCRRENQAARNKAAAYCEALAILMPPFFRTREEIKAEALVRYDKRGTDYCTPGLGRLKFKPPSTTDRGDMIEEYDPAAPRKAPANTLTESEIANIKKSVGFPLGMLATAYNTTEAVVKFYQSEK